MDNFYNYSKWTGPLIRKRMKQQMLLFHGPTVYNKQRYYIFYELARQTSLDCVIAINATLFANNSDYFHATQLYSDVEEVSCASVTETTC